MPPILAASLTIVGIVLLLLRDAREEPEYSGALWIPVMWMVIAGSRFVSQWMNLGGELTISATDDSSPLDAAYFLLLLIAAIRVLMRRPIDWKDIVSNNRWMIALMIYGAISILWSDFPFIAFKRWIKTLGHPAMALVILTDPDPRQALRLVLKRCAYFVLPLSVLFIKYYPEYGRGYDPWTGTPVNQGVGLTKNDLGYLCMTLGIFLTWHFLTVRLSLAHPGRRSELIATAVLVWMAMWLLLMSNSATSLATYAAGTGAMLVLGSSLIDRRHIFAYVVVFVLVAFIAEAGFDVYENVVIALGRDPNLSDRTVVWADVLAMQDRPLFGFGFESFWLGSRLDALWEKWWWHPNQAHNGYIETYLNLGLVGLFLLLGLLLSTFSKICRQMVTDFDVARLRFALLLAILMFNYTEAGFKAVHFVWTMFHIIAIDVRRPDEPPPERTT